MSERLIARMVAPLSRALGNMLVRGTVVLANAATKMQTLQIRLLSGEAKEGVEHLEAYGFTARPHPGAECITLFPGGDRSHGVVIMVADRRYRPNDLQPGECAMYTDEDKAAGDHRIIFKRGKEIHLLAGASSIVMTPAGITITTPNLDIVKA